MTALAMQDFARVLASYSPTLLTNVAAKWGVDPTAAEPEKIDGVAAGLTDDSRVAAVLAGLSQSERAALALFRAGPYMTWRWDHAVRLLTAFAIPAPYTVLQTLLADGFLVMRAARKRDPDDRLPRFEIADGAPAAALPRVALSAPLASLDLPVSVAAEPPAVAA
ncbi:MAG: hypothetical protein ACRDD1_05920, partial [Planctomycetia bacterium]